MRTRLRRTFAVSERDSTLPSHWRFDAIAEYKFSDNFSVQLNVVNLTDEVYYDAFYRSNFAVRIRRPGKGRTPDAQLEILIAVDHHIPTDDKGLLVAGRALRGPHCAGRGVVCRA